MFRSILPRRNERSLGELGERLAAKYLRKKKYKVVDRNVRFDEGEIDIVAVDDQTVVFVEVKTRSSADKGEPWEAVDEQKQKKILATASLYLKREDLLDQKSRFDIVSITWSDPDEKPEIQHFENAFEDEFEN